MLFTSCAAYLAIWPMVGRAPSPALAQNLQDGFSFWWVALAVAVRIFRSVMVIPLAHSLSLPPGEASVASGSAACSTVELIMLAVIHSP